MSDEPVELWNIEHEEKYPKPVEFKGINSGNEVFQVFTNTFEFKVGGCRDDSTHWWRQAYLVWVRGSEYNAKPLETGEHGLGYSGKKGQVSGLADKASLRNARNEMYYRNIAFPAFPKLA